MSKEYQLNILQKINPPDSIYIDKVMRDFEKNALRLNILNEGQVIVNYSEHDENQFDKDQEMDTHVNVKWTLFKKGE